MNILQYVLRRFFLAIFVLLGVVVITFILSHSLGGDPVVAWLGRTAGAHPALAEAYRVKYHLRDPLWVQFYYYVSNLLQGNLGVSPSRGFIPVSVVIGETLPLTLQIAFFAIVLTLGLGIVLGVVSAKYHHRTIDRSIRSFYLAGISSPVFFLAILLLIVFTLMLHLFPSGSAADPSLTAPTPITWIPMLDSLIELNFTYFLSSVEHTILPSLALALGTFGVIVRVLRSSMLEVMHANYIRTARAKGLDENTVFFKHGLRNAMIPIVTLASLVVTWMMTGTIFVENIFAYPGIGQYVFQALSAQDYPGILATTLVFAIIIVSSTLAADILYAIVDPQIRLG
ncbi:MAG: ABC transporter permease [Candidatus Bathyarchaeia archaeon]